MTDPNDQIIMPLGWEAGRPVRLADALVGLAIEMMAHRTDLLSMASALRPSDIQDEFYQMRALDLEKYVTALYAIALQVDPTRRWRQGEYGDLLTMARKNGVTLPDWMTIDK